MIEKAVIEITVNTDKNTVDMEVTNPPEISDKTREEFVQKHPAYSLACGIVEKISQEIKATAKIYGERK